MSPDPGLYESWNYMIKNSQSEYITNANLDDRLFPQCIEKHIKALDENPSSDLAYCENILSYEANDSFKNYNPNTPVQLFPEGGGPFYKPNMIGHNYPHNHPVWRRSLHDRFGYLNWSNDGGAWSTELRLYHKRSGPSQRDGKCGKRRW